MTVVMSGLLVLLQALILFCLAYQAILMVASARTAGPTPGVGSRRLRFAIVVPAHNEAPVLPATLARLKEQSYPAELYDVHVVADHCTDATAEVTRLGGGVAHERSDPPQGRKAYALQWVLERVLQDQAYDAVAIFDADSLVDPGFLDAAAAHLQDGKRVLQGQHIIHNPDDSGLAAVAAVDMKLNNRLRNQSRANLGLSCRLMGDAMVFDARVLREFGWPTSSLNEDREYGYELLLRGIRVQYVPEARSYGQAASTWRQAEPQRLRWYREVTTMQRRLAGRLFSEAVRSRSVALMDAVFELLMPAYSFLVASSTLNVMLVVISSLALPSARGLLGVAGSVAVVVAWLVYPVAGLCIDRAPAWAYRAVFWGPMYLAWRLWISLLVRVRGDRIGWLRTQRREESNPPNQ